MSGWMLRTLILFIFLITVRSLSNTVHKSYIIISNLQSGSNIGAICRNSLAFGVAEVIVVGRRDFFGKMRGADRGAKFKQKFSQFSSTEEAVAYLKSIEPTCKVLGIEIAEGAVSISDNPYNGPTAFVFGNEGGGLSEKQRSVCDSLAVSNYQKNALSSE